MWQPDEASLKGLLELLNESQSHDNARQAEVYNKITELSKQPEFANYIVYILSINDNPNLNTLRLIAGATLKGVLERNWDKMSNENLNYVKIRLMESFTDPSPPIRSIVANAMTTLFVKLGFHKWPELIQYFVHNLNQDNAQLVESTLECITKILEDMTMDSENLNYFQEKNSGPLGELIPKLLAMCDPRLNWNIKVLALQSLNLFTNLMPPSFLANIKNYFEVIKLSSADEHQLVRQRACEGFIGVLERRKDFITENLEDILERVLRFTVDPSKEVRGKACLFWNEYLIIEEDESMQRIEALEKCLEYLVPALIDCLPYTQEDLMALDSVGAKASKSNFRPDDEDEEEGIREVPDEDDDEVGEWTLRREAGRALEALSRQYEGEIFFKAQNKLVECLKNDNWLIRESGILCLGAIGKGASDVIYQHFQDLFPYLMNNLADSQPLVQCIACWTLSRFTSWIVENGRINQDIINQYLQSVLKLMIADNVKVQEASCTALSQMCNKGQEVVEHYSGDVIQIIKIAADKYSKESIKYLYDSIGSFTFKLWDGTIKDSNIENTLMEILEKKWVESSWNDLESKCLIECTESAISAVRDNANKYAEKFIPRLLLLVYEYVKSLKADDKKHLYQKKEIAISCFDLFDTFVGIMESNIQQYFEVNDYQQIFFVCVEDQDAGLKQIVLSSANLIIKYCPNVFRDRLEPLAEVLLKSLYYAPQEVDPQGFYIGICNNSANLVGDMALIYTNEIQNYVQAFAIKICEIFNSTPKIHKGVAQTLSIAIGKLALANPDAVAPLLDRMLKQFCMCIQPVDADNIEVVQAYRGLFAMILKNPSGVMKDFTYLCYSLVNFAKAPKDLFDLAGKILQEFKAFAGDQWPEYFSKFPDPLQQTMTEMFHI